MRQVWGKVVWGLLALAAGAATLSAVLRDPLPAQRAVASASAERGKSGLARASSELLRGVLEGAALQQDLSALLQFHPRLRREPKADRDGLVVYEEALPAGRALYFFQPDPKRLARVQVAVELANEQAVVERVLAQQQQLGAPSGVWDCPAVDGQLPTRRYTFRRGPASAADVYALIGKHALATFYVASTAQIAESLLLAGCAAIQPENAGRFPAVPLASGAATR